MTGYHRFLAGIRIHFFPELRNIAHMNIASGLTTSDIEQFRELGYCVVDGLYDPSEIQEMEDYFEDYKLKGHRAFEGRTIEEVDRTTTQVRAMHPHRHSDVALGWALHPNVMDALHELLGTEAYLAQTMYYFKPPGTCGQGMHQDDFYLLTKPHHCMAAWTAIDDADKENGCLYMVPGSHKEKLLCPEGATQENHWNHGKLSLAESTVKAVPCPVKRGQTVFFGGALIHGSTANRSKTRSRRTFIGHYCDGVTETISKHYHPVLDMQRNTVSRIEETLGGGPCGGTWQGEVH